jgi:hypothetical protein
MDVLRQKIKEIIKEIYLNEFSDEEFNTIASEYSNKRIILSHQDEIKFVSKKDDQRVTYKPKGLWYGFGISWLDWVRSEMPDWEKDYKNIFLLDVNDSSILKMSTKEELLDFTKKYSQNSGNYFERNMIDWKLVANDYDGIEINPYIHSARMDEQTNWYYPWDVASGCIWSTGGIRSIKKIEFNN